MICLCAIANLLLSTCSLDTIRAVDSLRRALQRNEESHISRFEIQAPVWRTDYTFNSTNFQTILVGDATNVIQIFHSCRTAHLRLSPGDIIRAKGVITNAPLGRPCALASEITTVASQPLPKIPIVSTKDVITGHRANQIVTIVGMLTDIIRDEVDPSCFFLVITDKEGSVFTPRRLADSAHFKSKLPVIGSTVSLTGYCNSYNTYSWRNVVGMQIDLYDPTDLKVLRPPSSDPYNIPLLHNAESKINPVVAGDLSPKRVVGRVLAVWQGNQLLLRTKSDDISKIQLAQKETPRVGDTIEAAGTPETDLYQLNLSKAIWRTARTLDIADKPPKSVSARQLLTDKTGQRRIDTRYSGRAIRLSGLVRALPAVGNGDLRLNLLCEEYEIPIDFSSVPTALEKIEDGCTIEATGICVIETENWRPQTPFPHATGFSIILRTADDIRIIGRPPWWTPKKLAIVIGLLLLALVVIGIRNRVLKKIAELRVKDRTQLAVELHDALSQTLTSVALELQTTAVLASASRPEASDHLDIASKSLLSCRQELRNCLQDLRSTALDQPDLNEAIRLTLEPHLGAAKVALRFNVPRSVLTDNATHAILRIIRELTLNAIRHGHADSVRIAGAIDGGILRFSVRDNGSGFDPGSRPGVRQGHFGLQGIQERVRSLGGSLKIESASGKGTRISGTIRIDIPKG